MPKIHILDESTINKIAAGEVIERPASVVKELVENSIDADASDIRVRIQGAGKDLIEIVDNGCGMDAENLKIAFIQHSTSKILDINDLEGLGTMGFRGEALSSIASVAEVEVSTKEKRAKTAHFVSLKKGKMSAMKQIGRDTGTTISVKKLFSGHPARLKYLKSDRVEMGHIIQIITERALANPEIAFKLHNDGIEVINVPKVKNLPDRINDIMGRRVARELVSFIETEDSMTIIGHLAKPTITKATKNELFIFVNGRPVASPKITQAIENGYSGMLMRNRHPVGVLMLDIDPKVLDVNVHPTKRKVRFADEKKVARFVEKCVAAALGNTEIIPDIEPRQKDIIHRPVIEGKKKRSSMPKAQGQQTQIMDDIETEAISQGEAIPRMKVIGQILNTYILAQSGSDLLIVDQHAAHERINLDRLKNSKKAKKAQQKLITPIPLNLGKKESQLVEHYRQIIEDFGFKIEPFGKDTYLVRAVPSIAGHLESEKGLLDMIDELSELGKARSIEDKWDDIRHLIACHSSIRAGERLSNQRMAKLIEELHTIDNPFHCAHGRPTIVRITQRELEKLFKRIV
ncbi:MAG: DNA mismatch repair endonuclease MutL [Thermoplasmata archaeon]|nr:DNA mismatch repair endonuclease MutL [Thermoplasmata archaeon]